MPCCTSHAGFEKLSPFETDRMLNTEAPDFIISDSEGSKKTLSSFRGSLVLLSFWSSKCPSCIADVSSLKKLGRIINHDSLKIVFVHAGHYVDDEFGTLAVNDADLNISVGIYRLVSLPTTMLIDRTGKIIKIFRGQQNWTDSRQVEEIKTFIIKTLK